MLTVRCVPRIIQFYKERLEGATVLRPCLSHILSWWCGGRQSLTAALVLDLLASGNKGHY